MFLFLCELIYAMSKKSNQIINKAIYIIIFTSIIGNIYTVYNLDKFDTRVSNFDKEFTCRGKILSYEKKTKYMYKYIFKIDEIYTNDCDNIVKVKNKGINIYLYLNDRYDYGDVLTVNIEYVKPKQQTNKRWI